MYNTESGRGRLAVRLGGCGPPDRGSTPRPGLRVISYLLLFTKNVPINKNINIYSKAIDKWGRGLAGMMRGSGPLSENPRGPGFESRRPHKISLVDIKNDRHPSIYSF